MTESMEQHAAISVKRGEFESRSGGRGIRRAVDAVA
jgi:hypothetical protein